MSNPESKQLVFMPNVEGLAHIIRSAVLAESMSKIGYKCKIIIPVEHSKIVSKIAKNLIIETVKFDDNPAQLFRDVAEEYGKSNTVSRSNYEKLTKPYLHELNKYPDAVAIVDSHPFARAAAVLNNMNNIWIGTPAAMPYMSHIPGLTKSLAGRASSKIVISLLAKATYNFLYIIYKYMGEDGYSKKITVKDVIEDTAQVPKLVFTTKNTVCFEADKPNFYMSEPLFSKLEIGHESDILRYKKLIDNRKSIYISFGGTGYSPVMIKKLIMALLKKGFVVLCSRGTILKPGDLEDHPNLLIEDFIPGLPAALAVDLIVSHGSQGTVEQALVTNTPLIAFPFNLDQIISVGSANKPNIVNYAQLDFLKISKISNPSRMSQYIESISIDKIMSSINKLCLIDEVKPSLGTIKQLNNVRIRRATKILEEILAKYFN
ncbi:hypothetical protein H6800_03090 [Candidatus Nomurabacteria bacterium]|nr:hypothetical protein [Candidatus Nomurabacteria bacterium]